MLSRNKARMGGHGGDEEEDSIAIDMTSRIRWPFQVWLEMVSRRRRYESGDDHDD